MGFSQQFRSTMQKEARRDMGEYDFGGLYRQRVFGQRNREGSVARLENPSNLPRARSLGYKAKQGFFVVQVRVRKGSGLHRRPARGRKPKRMGVKKLTRRISRQSMAEQKAGKKYPNCEVLNSYWVGEDGKDTYYEAIMVDTASPSVRADRERNWIVFNKHTKRAERGLTSSGKKGRGLKRGRGHEKNYPSQRAHNRKAK